MSTQHTDGPEYTKGRPNMNTLDTIIKYGLTVRQIPKEKIGTFEMRHHKPGNEIVRVKVDLANIGYSFELYCKTWILPGSLNFEIDHEKKEITRLYTREVKPMEKGGWWMCKQDSGTSSSITWSKKTDNLAPTLQESVALFLEGMEK